MIDDDDFDDLFEDDFFNDEDCPDDMEDILEELEGEDDIGDRNDEPIDEGESDTEDNLSLLEMFFIGSIAGQAYSDEMQRKRLLKPKKPKL